jgi:hypothetical protein
MTTDNGTGRHDIDDEMHDPEQARITAESRPVVDDQEPSGEQGISSDKPGVDAGGYPDEPHRPT